MVPERNKRKTKMGYVVNRSGKETVAVKIESLARYPVYEKVYKASKTYIVHNNEEKALVGDKVKIMECRPLSKRKNWRIVEIIKTGNTNNK
ncbi:MAG: 30S ribosomal protein S17 [bacterium]|nr:30S ribosomal protein S17 [bacterium]